MTFNIGDKVLFGRTNGEKTEGRIVKINSSSIKVEQTEARGGRPIGTIWRVAPSFVYPLESKPALPTLAPLIAIPQMPGTSRPSYRIGQRVSFTAKGRTITGTVVRVNQKTLTVENCDDGSRGWRVSPAMVSPSNLQASM